MTRIQQFLRPHATALTKTASYTVIHIAVAALVAFAVTGDWWVALTLSLLEPCVQSVAYFVHEKAWARRAVMRWRALVKTGTYYLMHLVVAAGVAFAVTGDWVAALTLSLLEPTVQMVCFFVHEKLWERKLQRASMAAGTLALSYRA